MDLAAADFDGDLAANMLKKKLSRHGKIVDVEDQFTDSLKKAFPRRRIRRRYPRLRCIPTRENCGVPSPGFCSVAPRLSFQINATEDIVAVVVFVLTASVITYLVRWPRRLGEAAALRDQLRLIIDTIPAVVWSNLPDGSAEFLNQRP
jgi:hypothetical protein